MSRRLLVLALCLVAAATAAGVWLVLRPSPAELRARRVRDARRAMAEGRFEDARVTLSAVAAEGRADPEILGDLAVCLARSDRVPEAADAARRALEADPTFAPAHAILSLAARRAGDTETAVREARLATEGRRVPPDARLALARLLLDSGAESEGLREFTRAVEDGEGGPEAIRQLAMLLGDRDPGSPVALRARRALAEAADRAAADLDRDPADPAALADAVRLLIGAGRPERAADALRDAAGRRPLASEESLLLARALRLSGDGAAADRVLDGLAPEGAAGARALLEAGRVDAAIAAAEAAFEAAPRGPATLRIRLDARLAALRATPPGAPEGAIRLAAALAAADDCLAVRPLDEHARRARCELRLDAGRAAAALEDATTLRERAPGSPAAAWLAGNALLELGYAAGALPLLVEGRPGNDPAAAARVLRAAVEAGDAARIREMLAEPDAPADAALLAAARAALGETEAAADLAARSDFARASLNHRLLAAILLARAGRPAPARAVLDDLESISLGPAVLLRVGDLRALLGDAAGAERAWERVAAGGSGAVAALIRLGERRLGGDRDALDRILARLRAAPGGEVPALVLDGRDALRRGRSSAATTAAEAALACSPRDPGALVLRLGARLRSGASAEDLAAAADAVLAVMPGHPAARAVRSRLLLARGDASLAAGEVEAGLDDLSAAADASPAGAPGRLLAGLVRGRLGDLEAAEADAAALSATEGGAAAGAWLAGMIRLRQGRLEEAVDRFRESARLRPDSPAPLEPLGAVLLSLRRVAEARAVAERWAELEPGRPDPERLLAAADAAAGETDAARDRLRAAVRRWPEDASFPLQLARLLLSAGRGGPAGAVLEDLLAAHPDAAAGWRLLVEARLLENDPEAALAVADRAAARPGRAALGHRLRAHVAGARGDSATEDAELKAAIEADPEDAAAHALLGERRLAAGDLGAAAEHLRRAAELAPEAARVRTALGVVAQMEGRTTEARRHYEAAISLDPLSSIPLNNLADLLSRSPGSANRAVELARRAVARDPENGEFHDTLAGALAAAGRTAEAADEALRAAGFAPRSRLVLLRAAELLLAAGRTAEARAMTDRAASLVDPEEEPLARRLSDLRRRLPPR